MNYVQIISAVGLIITTLFCGCKLFINKKNQGKIQKSNFTFFSNVNQNIGGKDDTKD